MKCKKCGQVLQEGMNFCSNCGQVIEKDKEEDNKLDETKVFDGGLIPEEIEDELNNTIARDLDLGGEDLDIDYDDDLDRTQVIDSVEDYFEDDYDYEDEGPPGRIKKSKGMLIGIGLLFFLVIGVMVIRGMGGGSPKDDLIENFIDGLVARDISDVRKLITSPQGDLKIDSGSVESLFKYIDKNPSFIDQTRTDLERQSKFYDDKKSGDIGEVTSNFTLRRSEKNQYFIEVTPYYMNIKVGAEGTRIFIDGKEVGLADKDDYSQEFGPFMPGTYKLSASYEVEGSKLEAEKLVDLIDDSPSMDKQVKEFILEMEVAYMTLVTDYKDGRIIINGKDTGKVVGDLEGGRLGPLAEDSKVKVMINTPFGDFESKEYSVAQSGERVEIGIDIVNEESKNQIMSASNQFIEDDIRAKKDLSMEAYTNLINPEKDIISGLIDEMKEEGYNIESKLKKISYDMDSFSITKHEGRYYAGVDLNYEVEESYVWEFTTDTNDESRNITIYLRYNEDNKKWEVFQREANNSFNRVNIKEFNY